jgi:YidC/Oxa1 family membrane protein insertase
MEQARRLISFFLISFCILILWGNFLGPALFPNWNWPQNQQKKDAADDAANGDKAKDDGDVVNADKKDADNKNADPKGDNAKDPDDTKKVDDPKDPKADDPKDPKVDDNKPDEKEPPEPKYQLPTNPIKSVTLGSTDPKSGFAMSVDFTSIGAAARAATLNDPKFVVSENPDKLVPTPMLRVLGNNLKLDADITQAREDGENLTFDIDFPAIDKILRQVDETATTRTVSWELVEPKNPKAGETYSVAVFRLRCPDDSIEFEKKFTLNKAKPPKDGEVDASKFMLDVEFTVRNLGEKKRAVQYVLQGPVGLPLENADTTNFYRSVQAGFLEDDGDLSAETLTASEIVSAEAEKEVEDWKAPLKYMGVDVQYFTALFFLQDQLKRQDFETVTPMVAGKVERNKALSDVSITFISRTLAVAKDKPVTQSFQVFLGPKDYDTLASLEADETINFGWFPAIGHFMIWLLQLFHGWGLPFGIAIILLTCVVRGLMFPISKKQALSQKRMKELQPEIAALREKYKDDKQKMAQAQMELYRKANFNPFAGCLPLFLQLPIFVALYNTVGSWVELRMASFLWVDNLAAPDGLIDFGENIWLIGRRFNLLPVLTIVLFYAQQKMFMPAPSSPEMASQQKMMNFMLIIFLFIFYNMPAGLCVYFVASSMWGMGERKLLDFLPQPPPKERKPKKENYFSRLMKQMQEVADMKDKLKGDDEDNGGSRLKNKKKR